MNQVERIGRFEVQDRLRANPFAILYRGRDPFDGHRVQIKFCVATDESIRRSFLAAAEEAAGLRHPNIATVFEFGSGDGKPYLVQEAFSEDSLSDLLVRGEPVDDVLKLYYLVQIARGLQYAHQRRVLHRELRPASILVDRSADVKISDFGTARLASAFTQLGNGAHRWPAVGWLVPELLLGLELDARSDIYGYGALAYELLTGQAPFVAQSLADLVPQILESEPRPLGAYWPECPPELDRLVLRCMARDPGQRFDTMDEVVDELGVIVPVTDPSDAFEEERTLVIEDINTVYVAETESRDLEPVVAETDVSRGEKRTTAARPVTPPPSRVDWQALSAGFKSRGREAASVIERAVGSLVSNVGSRLMATPPRIRAAGLVLAALLLFGVVGRSWVKGPDHDAGPLPTMTPELPAMTIIQQHGLLIVDTQPWSEVLRIINARGDELALTENRFTPLLLELEVGEYQVEVSRPELDRVEICQVSVLESTTARCEPQLAVLSSNDFFKHTGWWQ